MKAEYISHMGNDLTTVNSARVSFNNQSDWEVIGYETEVDYDSRSVVEIPITQLSEKDQKLINFLGRNNHWTPFSHSIITMRETVPIFVARQR